MKEIKLTQGKVAFVDDADYEELNKYKWIASKTHTEGKYMVCRWQTIAPNIRQRISMHRYLLSVVDSKTVVDHINNNPLDNQRHNLRICTQKQNAKNRTSKKDGKSKYLGVSVMTSKKNRKNNKKWVGKPQYVARIRCDNKEYYLGSFPFTDEGEILAAKAYDNAAKNFHGEFANLNFKI